MRRRLSMAFLSAAIVVVFYLGPWRAPRRVRALASV